MFIDFIYYLNLKYPFGIPSICVTNIAGHIAVTYLCPHTHDL